jgi:hypothetical protein
VLFAILDPSVCSEKHHPHCSSEIGALQERRSPLQGSRKAFIKTAVATKQLPRLPGQLVVKSNLSCVSQVSSETVGLSMSRELVWSRDKPPTIAAKNTVIVATRA